MRGNKLRAAGGEWAFEGGVKLFRRRGIHRRYALRLRQLHPIDVRAAGRYGLAAWASAMACQTFAGVKGIEISSTP